MQGKYGILVRAINGEIIDRVNDYTSLRILMTLNQAGSWSISSRITEPCPFDTGMGIVVVRNGDFLYGGYVEKIQDTLDVETGLYKWQVNGSGDLGYLGRRICYVDPSTGSTTTYDHYNDSGVLSDVVMRLINRNLGQDALEARREPIITSVEAESVGENVSVNLRFQNLLKAVTSLCRSNGYNIRPMWEKESSKVYYNVFTGRNLSQDIIFTEYLNNIVQSEYIAKAPEANFVLAGGTGEMTERQFYTATNADSVEQWGRIEAFQDARNQHDLEDYTQETLNKKTQNLVGYSCVASDSDNAPQFGVDYDLGDIISMKVGTTYIAAEVQQVEINVSNGVESISPKFGTIAVGQFREIFSQLSAIRDDVDELLGTEIE